MNRPAATTAARQRQSGAALLALVLVVVIAVLGFLIAGLIRDNPRQEAQARAQQRMAEARDALVGFAVAEWCRNPVNGETPQQRLPCPDLGGGAEGMPAAACGATWGRMPWRALATGPLQDAEGLCLWYRREAAAGPVVATLAAPGEATSTQGRADNVSGAQCGDDFNETAFLEAAADPERNDVLLAIDQRAFDQALLDCPPPPPPPPPPPAADCDAPAQVLTGYINGNLNGCRVMPGNNVRPACQTAANQLAADGCSCGAAATAFINPPCLANLNPPQCQTAIAALNSCN